MSEIVTGGVAVVAAGACAATVGVALGVGYVAYRGLTWLSGKAQRKLAELERELSEPPEYTTTREAQETLKRQVQRIKAQALQSPELRPHAEAVGRLLAVRTSPLGHFLNASQWEQLSSPKGGKEPFQTILAQAGERFTRANAEYVARSVIEAAAHAGFSRQRFDHCTDMQRTLVMEDSEGRALIADVTESDTGAKVKLDLTGFGDGSCHGVMDRVLSELARKRIRLDGIKRQSHYRREGMQQATPLKKRQGKGSGKKTTVVKTKKTADTRLRQAPNAARIKN